MPVKALGPLTGARSLVFWFLYILDFINCNLAYNLILSTIIFNYFFQAVLSSMLRLTILLFFGLPPLSAFLRQAASLFSDITLPIARHRTQAKCSDRTVFRQAGQIISCPPLLQWRPCNLQPAQPGPLRSFQGN